MLTFSFLNKGSKDESEIKLDSRDPRLVGRDDVDDLARQTYTISYAHGVPDVGNRAHPLYLCRTKPRRPQDSAQPSQADASLSSPVWIHSFQSELIDGSESVFINDSTRSVGRRGSSEATRSSRRRGRRSWRRRVVWRSVGRSVACAPWIVIVES